MASQQKDKSIMTAQEVSDYLRISLSTVHHLTRTGRLRSQKVGKSWKYDRADVEQYLERGFEQILPGLSVQEDQERRFFDRRKCAVRGEATISLQHLGAWSGDGTILNYSDGGILFETRDTLFFKQPVYADAPVTVKVRLDSLKELELEGRIVRCESEGKTLLGIAFSRMEPQLGLEFTSHGLN